MNQGARDENERIWRQEVVTLLREIHTALSAQKRIISVLDTWNCDRIGHWMEDGYCTACGAHEDPAEGSRFAGPSPAPPPAGRSQEV